MAFVVFTASTSSGLNLDRLLIDYFEEDYIDICSLPKYNQEDIFHIDLNYF